MIVDMEIDVSDKTDGAGTSLINLLTFDVYLLGNIM